MTLTLTTAPSMARGIGSAPPHALTLNALPFGFQRFLSDKLNLLRQLVLSITFRNTLAMPHPPSIAARLRILRNLRGLTKEQLARRLRVQPRTLLNWETEQPSGTEPKASDIVKLCDALDTCADYLLGRVDTLSGLTPGTWIVDEDLERSALDGASERTNVAWRVPRRTRIVTDSEATQLDAAIERARKRQARGDA